MAQEMAGRPEGPDAAVLDAIQARAMCRLATIRSASQALQVGEWKVLAALGHVAIERAGSNSDAIAMQMRAVAAEIGLQSRTSDRTVEARIGEAMGLVGTWPALVEAFGAGRIGRGHVRVIAEAGAVLTSSDVSDELRAAYEAEMLALAETTTPARVAKAARRAADALVTEPLTVRHQAARETRRVRRTDGDDGMSWLGAYVPTVLAKGAEHRLLAGALRRRRTTRARSISGWPTRSASCCSRATAPRASTRRRPARRSSARVRSARSHRWCRSRSP